MGVLFWTTRGGRFFDFGHERPNRTTFGAPAGPLDYYLLYGPEPKTVVERYAWLTGPTPLPPMWSLGFQQSRWSYAPQAQVERLRGGCGQRRFRVMCFGWISTTRTGTGRLRWTGGISGFSRVDSQAFRRRLSHRRDHGPACGGVAGQGYAPYDTGVAGDHFVKEHGKEYVGSVWPGPSVFPDFTRAETRTWFGGLFAGLVKDGVAGIWNDMNEPAVFLTPTKTMPDDVEHRIDEPGFQKRTATHLEIHNIYGMENTRATQEGLLTLRPNVRPFVMTRASYAGGQRYAVTWTGDNDSTWNHLKQTTPQLVNLGLSGFAMAGADVGGFAGSPSAELLTRWLMLAAFQPIDRDHSSKGTAPHEPWVDGPEQEAIRRRYIEERYRLMPYLYTTAEEMSRTGLPIVRPLFLEFPHATPDDQPLDLTTGGASLCLGGRCWWRRFPSPEQVAPYEVHLPPGVWYDYWTGARHGGAADALKDSEAKKEDAEAGAGAAAADGDAQAG